jgi:hypothetical protein
MNKQEKNVVLISASPKTTDSTVSGFLVSMVQSNFQESLSISKIDVRSSISGGQIERDFAVMLEADAIVFAFPLYFFCLPGILIRFLQDYAAYRERNNDNARSPKVYAAVNCGFPEPEINSEAVRVVKSFCAHTGAEFRFGIMIGGGGMLLGAKDAPFMKKTMRRLSEAFALIQKDIEGSDISAEDIVVSMHFPRKLYFFAGNLGWGQAAKKHGLKKKDLYAKPYVDNALP